MDHPKLNGAVFKEKVKNWPGGVKFEIFEKRQAASCKGEGFKRVKLRKEGQSSKFEKFEVGKVRSWKRSKLEKIEVGKDQRYKSSKLEMFEDYY